MSTVYEGIERLVFERGFEKGFERGFEKGRKKMSRLIIQEMLDSNMAPVEIASLTETTIEHVLEIKAKM